MAPLATLLSAALGGLVPLVNAHGIATALVQFPGGIFYRGYNPSYQYERPPPDVVGWSTPQDLQNTFVPPNSYKNGDIICHLGATPAALAVPVNAGDVLEVQWNTWPASHKGPVIDYLANCNGPCQNIDKTKLKWFKIQEVGLVSAAQDKWGGNMLAANNNSWLVRLPTDIAPGNYVLRHEIIALHAAGQANGAQNYPFCFSLAISGTGTQNPAGVVGTELYKAGDPGIQFDLFGKYSTYQIPGPKLYTGALTIEQTKPGAIKATSTGVKTWAGAAAKPTPAPRGMKAAARAAAAARAPAPTPVADVC